MPPGIAPVARATTDEVLEQITNASSDGGNQSDGSHHHHHHGDSSGSDSNHDSFSFSSDDGHSHDHGGDSLGNLTSDGLASSSFGSTQDELNHQLSSSSQEDRTGVLVTASFSVAAAMLIIYCIIYDSYKVQPADIYIKPRKRNGVFKALHTAEVFPFITALAVIVQGFIFVGVQAGGLDQFDVSGCRLTSELIWPTFWLISIIVSVFSVETAFRAVRAPHFQPRWRFTTPLCLAAVVVMLVGLWLTSFFLPSLDVCPGSLSWWTLHYSMIAVILASVLIFTHLICGAIITVHLMKSVTVDADERMAASRIVYTLAIDVVILVLVLPYWIQVVQGQLALDSSKVADVGITLTGMLLGALHLFMRTNAAKFAIRPKNALWAKNKKMRLFGPNDLHNKAFISQPLLEPRYSIRDHYYSEKIETPIGSPDSFDRESWIDPFSMRPAMSSGPLDMADAQPLPEMALDDLPLPPEPVQVAGPHRGRYTVFPSSRDSEQQRGPGFPPHPTAKDSWVSTSSDASSEYVELPHPLFAPRHDRKASTMTSATVEIGIRLSSAPDLAGPETKALPPPPATGKELPPTPTGDFPQDMAITLDFPASPQSEVYPQADEAQQEMDLPPRTSSKIMPPIRTNIGIGALGMGPKAGLKPFANQPVRSSPLSNTSKPPQTPESSVAADDASRNGSVSSKASSATTFSPRRPQSPAVTGLPSSPRPGRSPSSPRPQAKSPLASHPRSAGERSLPESAAISSRPDSPTDWPQWPVMN